MTLTDTLGAPAPARPEEAPPVVGVPPDHGGRGADRSPTGRRVSTQRFDGGRAVLLVALCLVAVAVALVAVLYAVGPLVHGRDQRNLMAAERLAITHAASATDGIYRHSLPTEPPLPGSPVGILAVPALGLQQAVVEGVGPGQTVAGPGLVPGTAGLGQPGNSAVVARRAGYGGPFGSLDRLRPGDRVVTATTEGESLYVVRSVRTVTLVTTSATADDAGTVTGATTTTTTSGAATTSATRGSRGVATESTTTLYGSSVHNQLTLVTSASDAPWNTDRAVVVVARMKTKPFTPTPQESKSPSQQGTSGDPSALAWLVLALLALTATLLGAVALYRRSTVRSAYLLTTAPLLAFTVIAAEAASHLLPAWL